MWVKDYLITAAFVVVVFGIGFACSAQADQEQQHVQAKHPDRECVWVASSKYSRGGHTLRCFPRETR